MNSQEKKKGGRRGFAQQEKKKGDTPPYSPGGHSNGRNTVEGGKKKKRKALHRRGRGNPHLVRGGRQRLGRGRRVPKGRSCSSKKRPRVRKKRATRVYVRGKGWYCTGRGNLTLPMGHFSNQWGGASFLIFAMGGEGTPSTWQQLHHRGKFPRKRSSIFFTYTRYRVRSTKGGGLSPQKTSS